MGNLTVDDTNTVLLSYNTNNNFQWFHGNWTDSSTQPPSNQSLLSSNDVNAKLVLTFQSPGTGIAYYGMMRSGGGSFRICIDCDPNQPAGPFDAIDALNRTDNGQSPPVLLYSKQGLSNNLHTVVLMNTNDTRVRPQGASQITLDRFVITTEDPAVMTVTDSSVSTATGSPEPTPGNSSSSSVNPGLIAGVVIGALALLALLIGLGLCWRHKRRSISTASVEEGRVTSQRPRDQFSPDPLVIRPSQRGHRPNLSESNLYPASSSVTLAALPVKGAIPEISLRESTTSAYASLPHSNSGATPTATSSSSENMPPIAHHPVSRPRTEMDAGPVPTDEETLPPDYAQVFNSQPQVGPPAGLSSGAAEAVPGNSKRS